LAGTPVISDQFDEPPPAPPAPVAEERAAPEAPFVIPEAPADEGADLVEGVVLDGVEQEATHPGGEL
jgi:hypothetical protein